MTHDAADPNGTDRAMGEDSHSRHHAAGGRDGSDEIDGDTELAELAELVALGPALHQEADMVAPGHPPVEAVVRRGRARRLRRRAGVTSAVLGVVAVSLTLTVAPRVTSGPAPPSTTPSELPGPPPATNQSTPPERQVVRPYKAKALSGGWWLGLLPDGRQNYLLAPNSTTRTEFDEQMADQRRKPSGDNLLPRSIGGGADSEGGNIWGSWRHPGQVRITVTIAGKEREATLYSLPGKPGWGVYYLDARHVAPRTTYSVTAYDADGNVFATQTHPSRSTPR